MIWPTAWIRTMLLVSSGAVGNLAEKEVLAELGEV
jgi:hypothetical protein